jgi:hypothetical protein
LEDATAEISHLFVNTTAAASRSPAARTGIPHMNQTALEPDRNTVGAASAFEVSIERTSHRSSTAGMIA